EHQLANVLKADGHLVELAPKFGSELVNELGHGKGLGNVPGQLARSRQVPYQQRKDLVWIDKGTVSIDGPNAVAVTVSAKACAVLSPADRLAQRFDVGLDGLGMDSSEARVPVAADFVAGHAIALENLREQARSCAVHGVKDEAKFGLTQALPVHQLFN